MNCLPRVTQIYDIWLSDGSLHVLDILSEYVSARKAAGIELKRLFLGLKAGGKGETKSLFKAQPLERTKYPRLCEMCVSAET